jgi:hypothetical protein
MGRIMDPGLEQRIGKVVARVRHRSADDFTEASDLDAVRSTHDRVLAEVPAALARLTSAVDETNDAIAEAGLHLKVEPTEQPYTIEASFVVGLWPADEQQRGLIFNVNHEGRLIALLSSRHSRTRLKSAAMAEADRAFFLDALVSLLEAAV